MTTTRLSNLPLSNKDTDSSNTATRFFNTYYQESTAVPASIVDAAISFFTSRGFTDAAAQSVAGILIAQAKTEGINVFKLIDTLKGLEEVQLSQIVREILNYNRLRTSILGTRYDNYNNIQYELRNLLP